MCQGAMIIMIKTGVNCHFSRGWWMVISPLIFHNIIRFTCPLPDITRTPIMGWMIILYPLYNVLCNHGTFGFEMIWAVLSQHSKLKWTEAFTDVKEDTAQLIREVSVPTVLLWMLRNNTMCMCTMLQNMYVHKIRINKYRLYTPEMDPGWSIRGGSPPK